MYGASGELSRIFFTELQRQCWESRTLTTGRKSAVFDLTYISLVCAVEV